MHGIPLRPYHGDTTCPVDADALAAVRLMGGAARDTGDAMLNLRRPGEGDTMTGPALCWLRRRAGLRRRGLHRTPAMFDSIHLTNYPCFLSVATGVPGACPTSRNSRPCSTAALRRW